jgi:hypothetical protein
MISSDMVDLNVPQHQTFRISNVFCIKQCLYAVHCETAIFVVDFKFLLILSLSANYLVPQQATSGIFFVYSNNLVYFTQAYISDYTIVSTMTIRISYTQTCPPNWG